MSVNGIGAAGYPVTGYQTRRTGNNAAEKSFAGSMGNVKGTGNTGFTLHMILSNELQFVLDNTDESKMQEYRNNLKSLG